MSIDIFETRTMLAALEQLLPVKTFFLDRFFGNTKISLTKTVELDIQKGTRRMAPFVSPNLQGKVVNRDGFSMVELTPPYVKPKMVTTVADIQKRSFGQNLYLSGGKTGAQLASEQLGKDLATLDEMITRREEWMAAMALQNGKVTIKGDGFDGEIDFLYQADHLVTLTGSDLWTDTAASNPIKDLETGATVVMKSSGLTVDTIVMGSEAAEAFINHPDVQKKLNLLKLDIARVAPTKIVPGARYIGTVNSVADIWVYHEWYYDFETKTDKPMMDPKKVFMGSSSARCTKHYGLIQDLECSAAVARFPKTWIEKDPSAQMLLLQSAPLPAIEQPDGFFVLKVIA